MEWSWKADGMPFGSAPKVLQRSLNCWHLRPVRIHRQVIFALIHKLVIGFAVVMATCRWMSENMCVCVSKSALTCRLSVLATPRYLGSMMESDVAIKNWGMGNNADLVRSGQKPSVASSQESTGKLWYHHLQQPGLGRICCAMKKDDLERYHERYWYHDSCSKHVFMVGVSFEDSWSWQLHEQRQLLWFKDFVWSHFKMKISLCSPSSHRGQVISINCPTGRTGISLITYPVRSGFPQHASERRS